MFFFSPLASDFGRVAPLLLCVSAVLLFRLLASMLLAVLFPRGRLCVALPPPPPSVVDRFTFQRNWSDEGYWRIERNIRCIYTRQRQQVIILMRQCRKVSRRGNTPSSPSGGEGTRYITIADPLLQ